LPVRRYWSGAAATYGPVRARRSDHRLGAGALDDACSALGRRAARSDRSRGAADHGWWQADPNDGSALIFLSHKMVGLGQLPRGVGLGGWDAIMQFHAIASASSR
jgi:hypothetical protein